MKKIQTPKILLVEDSQDLASLYLEYLKRQHYVANHVTTGQDAISFLQNSAPDIVLLDYVLPDMTGQTVLEYIDTKGIQSQVIVMTAHASVETAVTCIRLKTFDFLIKPFDSSTLLKTIDNAITHHAEQHPPKTTGTTTSVVSHGFIGHSPPMQHIYQVIERAAPSIATVFISGESGTGKEVCARTLHDESTRKNNPFIALNCAAIPHGLMESEIFGHIKGSFSGATADRQGAALLADGGTLFLDEICEMDMDLQTKLLRFIQTGTFQKVGSSKLEKVDIRFVCATNRNVLEEVEQKRFREDLYYRLHVIPIEMPALRERGHDITELAEYFLGKYATEENKPFKGFSEESRLLLLAYDWPGNIRQLQNIIRNIVVLNPGGIVTADMLPALIKNKSNPVTSSQNNQDDIKPEEITGNQEVVKKIAPLWESEKNTIEEAIALCEGNVPRAAGLLGISPSTIYRKRETWKKMENNKKKKDTE